MTNHNNTQLLRPAHYAEKTIIQNIISGTWKPGDQLPPERKLAQQLGITRQTLRETLKSLHTEGWITIQHGKPSVVNDYINDGSLGILKTLIKHSDLIPEQIIHDWLEFRSVLLPDFAQKAVKNNPDKILQLLANKPHTSDPAETFANYDWQLQELLVVLSQNTIVKMIFNDIKQAYLLLATKYFTNKQNRQASHNYYKNLEKSIRQAPEETKQVVKQAMQQSLVNFIRLIKEITAPQPGEN